MLGNVTSSNDHNSFQYPTVGRLESRLKTEFSPDPPNLNQVHSGIKGCKSSADVLMDAQYQQPLLMQHNLQAPSMIA